MGDDIAERERAIRAMPEAGSVVIDSRAAKALRTRGTPLTADGVLRNAGGFRAGDAIHVVQRGVDGGQRVVARGIAACSAAELEALAPGSTSIVIGGDDIALL
jgi:glutamate 5-kinase